MRCQRSFWHQLTYQSAWFTVKVHPLYEMYVKKRILWFVLFARFYHTSLILFIHISQLPARQLMMSRITSYIEYIIPIYGILF